MGDKTHADFITKIGYTIQDDAGILSTTTEIPDFLAEAVGIYSKDKPQEKVNETEGDGTYTYSLPTDWNSESSAIISSIEYPITGYQNPVLIDDNNWIIYKEASATKLRFLTISPQSSYSFRYTYSLPHSLVSDPVANTIPDNDFDAVCNLASSLCCRAMAAKYAQTEEPTIDADVIDYARKSDDYTALADKLEDKYNQHMGKGLPAEEMAKPAANAIKDIDMDYAWGGSYLTHPRHWR